MPVSQSLCQICGGFRHESLSQEGMAKFSMNVQYLPSQDQTSLRVLTRALGNSPFTVSSDAFKPLEQLA